MLKKRGPIVTQQYYSYDLVNVCLRRGNHKKRKSFSPSDALSTAHKRSDSVRG